MAINLVEVVRETRDGALFQVSLMLLGHNVKRLTPSKAKWSTDESFNAYVAEQAKQLESQAVEMLKAMGWTPP